MANEFNLPQDPQLAGKIIDSRNEINKKKVDHGFLGLLWGTSSSIPNNIAAFSIVLLVFFGIIYSILCSNLPVDKIGLSIKDCWTIITPIITLAFGYLFGEKTKKETP